MRRFGTLVMAALMSFATVAAAQPRVAAPATKAARVKPPVGKPAAAPLPRTVKSPKLDAGAAAILADANAFVKSNDASVTATALLHQYQRVGHELLLLANERREQSGAETL